MTAHGFNHCPLSKYIPGPKHNRRKKKKSTNIQGDVNQEKYGQSKYLLKVCKVANIICGN